MELIQYPNQRRVFDRSISERKLEDFRPDEYIYKEQINFRIKEKMSEHLLSQDSSLIDLRVNNRIKEEMDQEGVPEGRRRYFCIFCKMDFFVADEFLDHLESHPNGSFVLVKRDLPQPTPASSEQSLESEEPSTNSPILPESLQNQIKIEPLSEGEDEYEDYQVSDAANNEASDAVTGNSLEPIDPNHQLLVLSNPKIGDGPGEYLCNVCNAKFVYKNNLKSHLKRHLGIYPYVCFCGKRYQFKCKLNKHIEQAHAKIKNFKCPVLTCPKKYFTRNDLAFHISVTHQERQEIPCQICQKVFNSQKSLQIHCRKYHRNQEA